MNGWEDSKDGDKTLLIICVFRGRGMRSLTDIYCDIEEQINKRIRDDRKFSIDDVTSEVSISHGKKRRMNVLNSGTVLFLQKQETLTTCIEEQTHYTENYLTTSRLFF
jgi:hypothetical protein